MEEREETAQRAHDAYEEVGRVGEKHREHVFQEEAARGELARGEREQAHGASGPKAQKTFDEMERTPGQGNEGQAGER
jgi:hypothetical protein